MREDPIALLEHELVEAARRQAGHARRTRTSGIRRAGGGLLTAALVAVTLLVAGGALILLGGHKHPAGQAAAAIPGRQRLIDTLGVLRRRQTKADLDSPQIVRYLQLAAINRLSMFPISRGTPDTRLIRLATVTPWGEPVFVIPMKPPNASELAQLRREHPHLPPAFFTGPALRQESIDLYADGSGCCATSADIEQYGDLQMEGAGRAFAGGSTRTRFIVLVPDGVATVEFWLPRQSAPGQASVPVYRHPTAIGVRVHANVAAVEIDRPWEGGLPAMIWYSADDRVIRRIGNFGALNRVVAPPRPAPQTALSRAAERDPSTPNPVWITPRVGGPHTNFKLHFRVLLTDADYSYKLTGTRCPAVTVNGGSGGGTNDLRGRIWTDAVGAIQGQTWCPGSYRLAVTVMDLGRRGQLKHPAKPFGGAAFTVR